MTTTESLAQWLNRGLPVAARKLTEKHDICIDILSGIDGLNRRLRNHIESSEGEIANLFPDLKRKYLHKAEISLMGIERLWRRYFRVCKEITE